MVIGRASQWIEISSRALLANIRLFRDLLPREHRLTAVVKANAYGHGLAEVVRCVAPAVDCFAVHSLREARAVRKLAPHRPVLIMGYLTPEESRDLEEGMEVLVSTAEVLQGVLAARVPVPVHLKIDTGTHRQGVGIAGISAMVRAISEHGAELAGVATHFANIEDTLEHDFAREQLRVFQQALEEINRLGVQPRWIHAACSAAALLFPETHFNMSRIGISMYGHWSSRETRLSWKMTHGPDFLNLSPVATWKTRIGQLLDVGAGETVGYGRSWRASRPTRVAVLPVGYADGYARVLGNRSRVLVDGQFAPVIGRVCMNIMMVDVTDIPESRCGDEVVLIGSDRGESVTVEELAELAGTINYEMLTRLGAHIERKLV